MLFGASSGGYFPGDGRLGLLADRQLGRTEIKADVRPGGRREALLHAIGANADHGCRRTDADKRKAVLLLLDDKQWGKWSANRIARYVKVSQYLVSSIRNEHPSYCENKMPLARRGDQEYPINAANIGRSRSKPSSTVPATESVPSTEPVLVSSTEPVASGETMTEADLMPPDDIFPPGTVTTATVVDVSKSLEQKVWRGWRKDQAIKNRLELTRDALLFLAADATPAREFAAAWSRWPWLEDSAGSEGWKRLRAMLAIVLAWVAELQKVASAVESGSLEEGEEEESA